MFLICITTPYEFIVISLVKQSSISHDVYTQTIYNFWRIMSYTNILCFLLFKHYIFVVFLFVHYNLTSVNPVHNAPRVISPVLFHYEWSSIGRMWNGLPNRNDENWKKNSKDSPSENGYRNLTGILGTGSSQSSFQGIFRVLWILTKQNRP